MMKFFIPVMENRKDQSLSKRRKSKKVVAEFFFWLHTLILLAVLVSGLFLSIWWVILFLVIIKVQQRLFHGCIITVFEIRSGGIKKGHAFFQLAARRFTGLKVGNRGVRLISNGYVLATLLVALAATASQTRINL